MLDLRTNYIGLRVVVIFLALYGINRWRKGGLSWWMAATVSILGLSLLAYFGVYFGAGALQPYRFIIPALAFCTIPASVGFYSLRRKNRIFGIVLPIALFCVAVIPLFSGRPRHRLQNDGTPRDYLSGLLPDEQAVCGALNRLNLQDGRVLSNDWRLGAALPPCSGAQVIGGPFLWVWTTYGYSNAGLDEVFGRALSTLNVEEMSTLLKQYNVHWIVVNKRINPQYYTIDLWNQDHPGLFEAVASYGNYYIYQVLQPTTWFLEGSGQVNVGQNQIVVQKASQGSLILKYHWIESLRTIPPLRLSPVIVGLDPRPFIKVDNGNIRDFRIYQAYK